MIDVSLVKIKFGFKVIINMTISEKAIAYHELIIHQENMIVEKRLYDYRCRVINFVERDEIVDTLNRLNDDKQDKLQIKIALLVLCCLLVIGGVVLLAVK